MIEHLRSFELGLQLPTTAQPPAIALASSGAASIVPAVADAPPIEVPPLPLQTRAPQISLDAPHWAFLSSESATFEPEGDLANSFQAISAGTEDASSWVTGHAATARSSKRRLSHQTVSRSPFRSHLSESAAIRPVTSRPDFAKRSAAVSMPVVSQALNVESRMESGVIRRALLGELPFSLGVDLVALKTLDDAFTTFRARRGMDTPREHDGSILSAKSSEMSRDWCELGRKHSSSSPSVSVCLSRALLLAPKNLPEFASALLELGTVICKTSPADEYPLCAPSDAFSAACGWWIALRLH